MSQQVITAIERPRSRPKRAELFLDGSWWRTTNHGVVRELALKVGSVVDPDVLSRELDAAERRLARDQALRMLAYRARSRHELLEALCERGFPRAVAAGVVSDMEAAGYVDDDQFARLFVEDRAVRKGYGRRRVIAELIRKGLNPEEHEALLDRYCSVDREVERATQIARRRLGIQGTLDYIASQRRIVQFLRRRGYSESTIRRVARDLFGEKAVRSG